MLRVQRIVGVVLVLGLLAGSGVAFAVAQSLKSEPARVVSTDFSRARAFSPGCDCGSPKAVFSLNLSGSADLSVRITDRRGRVIRQMLDRRRSSGVVPLTWDGTDANGRQVPDGRYQVQVRFARGRWRAAPNAVITVDTRSPVVTAEMPAGRTIAYGADGGNGVYRYTVRSDEPGRIWPTVFRVLPDGTVEQIWRPSEPVPIGAGNPIELTWPAASGSPDTPADDGTYLVGYEMRDAAGNVARLPTSFEPGGADAAAVVRVRALDITPSHAIGSFDDQVQRRPAAPDDLPPGRPGRRGDRAACERRARGADPRRACTACACPARRRRSGDGSRWPAGPPRWSCCRPTRGSSRTPTTRTATASPISHRPRWASTGRSAASPATASTRCCG